MSGVADWSDMMTQALTVAPVASRDRFGNKTYGAAVTYRCRIVGKRRVVRNAQGNEVVSEQTVYLMTPNAVDPEGLVTLSTGDTGSTEASALSPPIIASARYPDQGGAHHSVLFL